MAINPLVYPNDFTFPTTKSGGNAVFSTVEGAYLALSIQNRDTALRQVNSRRIAMAGAIAAARSSSSGEVMPVNRVGKSIAARGFVGSVAYTGGVVQHGTSSKSVFYSFLFSNEFLAPVLIHLTNPTMYRASATNKESGKFAGGIRLSGSLLNAIDKISYVKPTVTRIDTQLSQPIRGSTGGMGTSSHGLFVNSATNTTSLNLLYRYDHILDRVAVFNNFLSQPRYSGHGGLSSKTNGYMMAGTLGIFSPGDETAVVSVDRIPYSGIATAPVASRIVDPGSLGLAPVYHAALSGSVNGYILGGYKPGASSSYSSQITRWNYATEKAVQIATQLTAPAICITGAGHSAAGFTFGGNTPDSNWKGSQMIQKLDYSTERIFVLDTKLFIGLADQPTVSDYLPSLY